MQFRANPYFQASLERIAQARKIYQEGRSFALAIYCSGLAVECLLRAFRWTEDPSFEGPHDLAALLKGSRLFEIDEAYMRGTGASDDAIRVAAERLRIAVNQVTFVWHNSLRFASEASLRAFLNKLGKLKGIKGNPLKKNALDVLGAQIVIDRGATLWNSKTKS